jgi:N utilization substance protein B
MLYQIDASGEEAERATRLFWSNLGEEKADEFADRLVRGWADQREAIDETIRNVSQHWRLERMARVDRNIIRLAVYELLNLPDVPAKVTLNEAVELAKRFGDEGSPAFVNGVLDRIASDVGKE